MDLPAQQVALLDAIAAVSERVVVVLSNGSAVALPLQGNARAVVEGWLLGQAGGSAIADLLLGQADPSGQLAETIPLRYADTPAVGAFPGENGVVRYGEGLLIGYRWYDARKLDVAYPFGHGLSYTQFAYSDVDAVVHDGEGRVEVAVAVTNTGSRAGHETVQIYVSDPDSSVFRPEQALKGFARVWLEPGDSTRVTVELGSRAFAWWHTQLHGWVVEGGRFEIRVGASSQDVRAVVGVALTGDDLAPELTPESTIAAWLAHPVAGTRLREDLGTGGLADMLADPQHGQMMRAIPLVRMSRFPGFPVREEDLAARAAEANRRR